MANKPEILPKSLAAFYSFLKGVKRTAESDDETKGKTKIQPYSATRIIGSQVLWSVDLKFNTNHGKFLTQLNSEKNTGWNRIIGFPADTKRDLMLGSEKSQVAIPGSDIFTFFVSALNGPQTLELRTETLDDMFPQSITLPSQQGAWPQNNILSMTVLNTERSFHEWIIAPWMAEIVSGKWANGDYPFSRATITVNIYDMTGTKVVHSYEYFNCYPKDTQVLNPKHEVGNELYRQVSFVFDNMRIDRTPGVKSGTSSEKTG